MAKAKQRKPAARKTRKDQVPPGATRKASDATSSPGGPPPSDLGDRHAAGTPGGGTEVGGLAGTNVGEGAPENADLNATMAEDIDTYEGANEGGPPYSGVSGGAVGGTPAEMRSKGGKIRHGIRPGGVHRGDSTIGTNPDSGAE